MHSFNDAVRTFELSKQVLDVNNPFKSMLAAASYAICSTFHTTLQATPGQLVFNRDMILPIWFEVQWVDVRQRWQSEIERNNRWENAKKIAYAYQAGDKVLHTDSRIRPKLSQPRHGPYIIEQVNANGTIHIRRGQISETVNLRRLTPFFE